MSTNGSTSQPAETPNGDSAVDGVLPQEENPSSSTSTQDKKFPVVEIFGPVIQGEGSQAGQQTMFIRFGGCDYRCTMCDSLHAVVPKAVQVNATYMGWEEIRDKLLAVRESTGVRWVTFSGGNPCMHKLDVLVDHLRDDGWFINVETQGTLWQEWVNHCTMVTISPKTYGMGEKLESAKLSRFLEKLHVGKPVCIKAVVFSAVDFEFALQIKSVVEDVMGIGNPAVAYYLSLGNPYPPVLNTETFKLEDNPVVGGVRPLYQEKRNLPLTLLGAYRSLSEEVLQDPRLKDFRFLPQLHVLTYGNESER